MPAGSPVDLNGDGVVSILDLILAARGIGGTSAPSAPTVEAGGIDSAMIEAWIAQARLEDDGSLAFKQGIENLEKLLVSLIPEETALLRNYPNPFNPETWIPYQLATPAEVALAIYDINGQPSSTIGGGASSGGYVPESWPCSVLGRTKSTWRICRQRSLFLHIDCGRIHWHATDDDSEVKQICLSHFGCMG